MTLDVSFWENGCLEKFTKQPFYLRPGKGNQPSHLFPYRLGKIKNVTISLISNTQVEEWESAFLWTW